jgi:hypothetical protein
MPGVGVGAGAAGTLGGAVAAAGVNILVAFDVWIVRHDIDLMRQLCEAYGYCTPPATRCKPTTKDPEDDCDQEWKEAYEMCRDFLSRPNPPRGITGGYTNLADCARGLVSERCGGNRRTLEVHTSGIGQSFVSAGCCRRALAFD